MDPIYILGILIIYTLSVVVGRYIVSSLLDNLNVQIKEDDPSNLGRYIGMFERFLVTTFVLSGNFTAIGLIFAGKSVARFKALDDRHFAEYYLLGTFASITIGIVCGLLYPFIIDILTGG